MNVKNWTVIVSFPGGGEKRFVCEGKGQAKRKALQALGNPVVQRLGGTVSLVSPEGKEEQL